MVSSHAQTKDDLAAAFASCDVGACPPATSDITGAGEPADNASTKPSTDGDADDGDVSDCSSGMYESYISHHANGEVRFAIWLVGWLVG